MPATTRTGLSSAFAVRAPIVAAILVLGVLAAAHLVRGGGWNAAWGPLLVPAIEPNFIDLRTITNALDAVRAGLNPYVDTWMDPLHRVYNYPRAWLWLAHTPLGGKDTTWLGIGIGILVMVALALLFDARSRRGWWLALGLALSPPVLLGVERGNCDLLLFSLLVFGIFASARWSAAGSAALRAPLIVALTVLKIYPFAASLTLLRGVRTVPVMLVTIVLGLIALRLSLHPDDLGWIFANTPQNPRTSYGSFVLLLGLHPGMAPDQIVAWRRIMSIVAILVALAAVALGYMLRARMTALLPHLEAGVPRDDVALACLAMWLLSFVLGANYDYRLIYLIATVPPLLSAYDPSRRETHRLLVWPLTVLVFVWVGRVTWQIYFVDELLDWLLFAAGAAWLGTTILARLTDAPDRAAWAASPSLGAGRLR